MDEIKNTTEAAQQVEAPVADASATTDQAAPVADTAAETAQEVKEAPQETSATAADGLDAQPTQPDTDEAQTPATPHADPANKAEVIERLKQIVYDGGQTERAELEHLKMLYYRYRNAEVVAARDQFVEEGGNAEDFKPAPDPDEENFKSQFNLIRELRNKAAEALEKEKQANLQRKREIIERLKTLSETPESADKGYDEVKKLQAEWKEIKLVPAEQATELWKNYQLYVEQYYDCLRLNHEMREYDFKKNLETKTHLCEAVEKLATLEDPVSAFHQLQKLHQEWRETGPVAKDLREDLWKRFKDASTVVNKHYQDHFEALRANEAENLEKKTRLCQDVEALDFDALKSYAQWDEMTKKVLALQSQWREIGFTPRKVNAEIFNRFRTACDRFFKAKTAYLKANRERFNANLTAKNALIEQAEALKDSTDWNTTTQKFVELQKQWKAIGPVAHKVSDAVWKRFNEACNYFFEQKNKATSDVRQAEEANLAQKKEVIAELEKLVETPVEDTLAAVRALQTRWGEIGHVPYNKKEKMYRAYRDLCDKIYDSLHETEGRRRIDNFRKTVAEKGGTELTRERARLQNILEGKKQEIQTYETNLLFFRSSSKKGNSLLADVEKKMERLKQDIEEIKEKIRAVGEQIKAEGEKK